MAYVKQNFVDGNVLYASELNHIEDGIADAALNDLSNVTNATVAGKIGTGAITAAKIAANAVSTVYTATIPTGWSGSAAPYSKAVTISGIAASDQPIIDLSPSSDYETAEPQIEQWGYVYRAVTAANEITFYATEKPDVELPVKVRCIRK